MCVYVHEYSSGKLVEREGSHLAVSVLPRKSPLSSLILKTALKDAVINPAFQVRRWESPECLRSHPGHTAGKWKRQNASRDLVSKALFSQLLLISFSFQSVHFNSLYLIQSYQRFICWTPIIWVRSGPWTEEVHDEKPKVEGDDNGPWVAEQAAGFGQKWKLLLLCMVWKRLVMRALRALLEERHDSCSNQVWGNHLSSGSATEPGSPRSRCCQGWHFLRTFSRLLHRCFILVSFHPLPFGCLCLHFLFCKDTVQIEFGHSLMTSFELNYHFKGRVSKYNHNKWM